jgi:hypothetical protein
MNRACSADLNYWLESPKRREHSKDLGVKGNIDLYEIGSYGDIFGGWCLWVGHELVAAFVNAVTNIRVL